MTNAMFYVYVAARSNDLDALNEVFEALSYLAKKGKTHRPYWYEGVGYAEENAKTPEEIAEFEEDYDGFSSEGYAHAVVLEEDEVTEQIKDEILWALGLDCGDSEIILRGYKDYDKVVDGVSLAVRVQALAEKVTA